jgi:hypothetical protein
MTHSKGTEMFLPSSSSEESEQLELDSIRSVKGERPAQQAVRVLTVVRRLRAD